MTPKFDSRPVPVCRPKPNFADMGWWPLGKDMWERVARCLITRRQVATLQRAFIRVSPTTEVEWLQRGV